MVEDRKNEPNEEMSFAELFDKTEVRRDFLTPGEKIEATIVKITQDWIFLDLGGKSEGYMDRKELADEDGNLSVKEGDSLTAYFLSSKHNEKLFTTRIGTGDSARTHIEEVWRNGIPIEGVVEKEIKGGFDIKLVGEMRGFCPYSQMDIQRVDNAKDYIGRRLSFRITEYGERGRNIILSNRAILEEQKKKEGEALKTTLNEGMIVKGTVVSIRDFGAFLDIGGLQGLLPISEICWERVEDIQERLSIGQTLDVAITKLDWQKNRISLSLKETLSDPWNEVLAKYPEGTFHRGTVVRLMKFGAFVNLGPGVDGLIHISKLGKGKRITHPSDAVKEGQAIEVRIDTIDRDQKRISLSIPEMEPQESGSIKSEKDTEDYYREYVEKAPASMGSFGDIMKRKLEEKKKIR
ncbi:MAG: 30S ribosomal protein S1 [Deltaproteobacteria bacterium]|nr:30S ribosomal protein S1 [Deltaproteobacteria bacterium]